GLQPHRRGRRPRPAGQGGHARRPRRGDDRRQDGGRRQLEAVHGRPRARRAPVGQRPRAGEDVRRGRERGLSAMSESYTPRRSVLYMPSSNARALEKAKTLPVDALIFDLEDAVGPDDKVAAREAACAAAASGEYGDREVTIRVNGIGTQWHEEDLAAASKAGPAGIVVPKVDSADEVRTLVAAMEAAGAPEHTKLWAM